MWNQLPSEIWRHIIIPPLSVDDLANLCRVCRKLRELTLTRLLTINNFNQVPLNPKYYCIRAAIETNDLETIKNIVKIYPRKIGKGTITYAGICGKVDLIIYMFNHHQFSQKNCLKKMVGPAARAGQLETLKHIHGIWNIGNHPQVWTEALAGGHYHIFDWLSTVIESKIFLGITRRVFKEEVFIRYGSRYGIYWLTELGALPRWTSDAYLYAIRYQKPHILEYLLDLKIPLPENHYFNNYINILTCMRYGDSFEFNTNPCIDKILPYLAQDIRIVFMDHIKKICRFEE